MKRVRYSDFSVVVVGGGHAGAEAAHIAARMGISVAMITLNKASIGRMSCNPAIGGIAKGHLVREIDALGGLMGKIADGTCIQFRMLNRSKGRAVWSPRAQADKITYPAALLSTLENEPNITIIEDTVRSVIIENNSAGGVVCDRTGIIRSRAVILTCGTFLNGKIHIGLDHYSAGRINEPPVSGLTEQLVSNGMKSGRLKTGTPPRVLTESIDFAKTTIQHGDDHPEPFSFSTRDFNPPDVPCFLTKTNPQTHAVLLSSLDKSPLYTGAIKGIGPRYCPSIEDKVVRFSQRDGHQIFLEPEWRDAPVYYVNGFSTSLPADIQLRALQTIPGMESVVIDQPGYAIEYDFFPPLQLKPTLETKRFNNLFLAGQINGSSGYEEAAAQGLIAGINAAAGLLEINPLHLKRSEAYIGVLIDDLTTKETLEPYRLFTSRAEFRLLLRADNADRRLRQYAEYYHTISSDDLRRSRDKFKRVDALIDLFRTTSVLPEKVNSALNNIAEAPVSFPVNLAQILKRPSVSIHHLISFVPENLIGQPPPDEDILFQVETEIKYEGYINRQKDWVDSINSAENMEIPGSFDYGKITALTNEAREKLSRLRPVTVGQASRIQGVSPSDISVILVHLKSR